MALYKLVFNFNFNFEAQRSLRGSGPGTESLVKGQGRAKHPEFEDRYRYDIGTMGGALP